MHVNNHCTTAEPKIWKPVTKTEEKYVHELNSAWNKKVHFHRNVGASNDRHPGLNWSSVWTGDLRWGGNMLTWLTAEFACYLPLLYFQWEKSAHRRQCWSSCESSCVQAEVLTGPNSIALQNQDPANYCWLNRNKKSWSAVEKCCYLSRQDDQVVKTGFVWELQKQQSSSSKVFKQLP